MTVESITDKISRMRLEMQATGEPEPQKEPTEASKIAERRRENLAAFEEFLEAVKLRKLFGEIIGTQRLKGAGIVETVSEPDASRMRLELRWSGRKAPPKREESIQGVYVAPEDGVYKISVIYRTTIPKDRITILGEHLQLELLSEDVHGEDFEPPMQEQIEEAVVKAFLSAIIIFVKLKLVDKRQEAQGTKSFFFETEKDFDYLPGQYFYITVPKLKYKDSRGATRHFTLSSSPTEGKIISITTRIRKNSGFKQTLDELEIGTDIEGEGPEGTFVLDEKEKGSHVLIAGGIGITPFRSMIKYAIDKNIGTQIHLIYSNSLPEQISFRKELENWTRKSDNFKLSMTVTRPEESKEKWSTLTGRIDKKMITHLTSHLSSPTFWLCGPSKIVDAMEKLMGELNISAGYVHSEKFPGY